MNNRQEVKYGILSNISFMVKESFLVGPSVLLFVLVIPVLTIGLETLRLFFLPQVVELLSRTSTMEEILKLIGIYSIGIILTSGLISYLKANVLFARIDVRTGLNNKFNLKLGRTSYPNLYDEAFRKARHEGERSLYSNASAGEHIWETISLLLESVLGIVVFLMITGRIDYRIVLIIAISTIISSLYSAYNDKRVEETKGERSHLIKEMNYLNRISSDPIYAKDIRIFSMKSWIDEVYYKANRAYRSVKLKEERIYFKSDLIDLSLSFLSNGFAYFYLVNLALEEGWEVSTFILMFNGINGLTAWLGKLLRNLRELHLESNSLSSLREFLEYPEPFKFEAGLSLEPIEAGKYEIELRDVYFSYDGTSDYSLEGINLKITPGEKLALVGLNGAGKTSLIKLVMGLYNPSKGLVLLNGKDINQYNREDIYRHFSAVFQENSILPASIYENISQLSGGMMDYEKADRLIKLSNLEDLVSGYPQGANTNLTKLIDEKGVEFSGGQIQRLLLARALYKDGPILVLDEPTAALDPIAENDMYLKYRDMTEGKTSIFISHRLSSTRFCDRIIFLDGGKIVEEGSHEELLALKGKYSRLYEIQSRYYKDSWEGMFYEED